MTEMTYAFAAQIRRRLAMLRTAATLRGLSDASLEDIGMNRADIEAMIGR
jgi:uncharacterized protein YjiS (DUF1127 family)